MRDSKTGSTCSGITSTRRANGIQHLVADVLTTNHLMFKVLHDAGLRPRLNKSGDGVEHLHIDLTEITTEISD
jgi:hypothetical protein